MAIRSTIWLTLYGGLAVVIAGECWTGIGSIPDAAAAPMAAPVAPAPARIAAMADGKDLARTALDRPLFAQSRRPPPLPAAPVKTVAAPVPPPKARLAGTITAGEQQVAFFDDAPAKQVSLHVGGDLGPWRVVAIYPGRVTLRSTDGSLIVKSMTGTTTPIVVSALRNWKPAPFHREE